MNSTFPTRQYPYQRRAGADVASAPLAEPLVLAANTLHRFILGLDDAVADAPPKPRALSQDEASALDDPFARLLRQGQTHPLTARTLVAELDATGMSQQSFVIGEGLHLPWTAESADLARQLRMVVAWKIGNELAVLLSTAPSLDSQRIFLQVIGWDTAARQFNFYERRLGVWIFAGSSRQALAEPTRGRGPFDSHVNGALVMKELKAPWLHWSSMAAFDLPGVAAEDTLQQEPLFRQRTGAEQLESLVRTSVTRWTAVRLDAAVTGNTFNSVLTVLRQLLTSTTVNLVSSVQESMPDPADMRLQLPITPFLDTNLLLDVLKIQIGRGALSAPWEYYRKLLDWHGYELRDENGRLARQGDTHFAFPAFERSIEDQKVVAGLVQRGLLSKRIVACLAMVDFPNPVWSARRELLLRHVPNVSVQGPQGWDLDDRILASIDAAGAPPGSPEAEFLDLWNVGDTWTTDFGKRLDDYLEALQGQLNTWAGFEAIGRLVESQRRRARRRPLLEFNLTLPRATKLPDVNFCMTNQATIKEI